MTFTKEDAKDDATIKSEVRGDLLRVAKQRSPEIFKHFENVCQQLNLDPGDVLADMMVKSINNQEYADKLVGQEVSMDILSRGEYRKEDIETVKSLAEEFDLTPDSGGEDDLIEDIIRKRIEASSTTPFDQMNRRKQDREKREDGEIAQLERQVEALQSELDRVKSEQEESSTEETTERVETSSTDEDRKELDDLFGGDEEEESAEESQEEEESDEIGSVDVTFDDSVEEEDEEKGEMEGSVDIDIDKSAAGMDEEVEGDEG